MEFKQLRHFLIVAQELNFTTASKKAYISQQALSKSVRELERELEVTLFERLPRGLALTEHGKLLQRRGNNIMTLVNDTISDLHKGISMGDVNIPVALTAGVDDNFPISMLFQFQTKHPKYRISTTVNSDRIIEEMLLAERLELGLVGARGDTEKLEFYPLMKSRTYVVIHKNNPLSNRDSVCLSDLKNESFLFSSGDYYCNSRLLSICNAQGFTPNLYHQAADLRYQIELVNQRQGIVLCPESVGKLPLPPELKLLDLDDDPFLFHIHLANKKNYKLTDGAYELKKFILENMSAD